MLCPKCKKYEYHDFCPQCGTPKAEYVPHDCECGQFLSCYQKFCSECGRAAPEIVWERPAIEEPQEPQEPMPPAVEEWLAAPVEDDRG